MEAHFNLAAAQIEDMSLSEAGENWPTKNESNLLADAKEKGRVSEIMKYPTGYAQKLWLKRMGHEATALKSGELGVENKN